MFLHPFEGMIDHVKGGLSRHGGFVLGFGDMERQTAVAEEDLIAGLEAGRAADLLAVEKRAVLRSDIVQFATHIGVNEDRTVATGDAFVADHHVVIRQSTDTVQAHVEGKDVVAVLQIEGESAPGLARDRGRRWCV
jgi:hypothetical protein